MTVYGCIMRADLIATYSITVLSVRRLDKLQRIPAERQSTLLNLILLLMYDGNFLINLYILIVLFA